MTKNALGLIEEVATLDRFASMLEAESARDNTRQIAREAAREAVREMASSTAPAPAPDREWMGAAEMAAHLGMTRGALYAAVERCQIPARRIGRRGLRFRKSEVEHAFAARRTGAPVRAIETVRRPINDDSACAVGQKGGGRW